MTEEIELLKGKYYLVEERTPDISYELFTGAISGRRPGLVVTRDYPPEVRKRFALPNCTMNWLTHLVGENHINPTALGLLLSRITNFVERNEAAIVILDGVEYLISQNSYDRILHFIHQIRDMIIISEGTMIMPMDSRVVSEKELAFLERNLEVLDSSTMIKGRRFLFELEDGLLKILSENER